MKESKFIRSNPHLPVRNLRQTIDYYRNTLGFEEEWTWANMDGLIRDGGVRRGEMWLLFGEDSAFTNAINSETHRLSIMWFVDNIDQIFAEFCSREIVMDAPLTTHEYGLREFAFVDFNGYYIRVAASFQND